MKLVAWTPKIIVFLFNCILAISLAGCASLNPNTLMLGKDKVIIVEQNPNIHSEAELMIARIGQVLNSEKLSKDERAALFVQRAVLYDGLGLWLLARYDFSQALNLQPRLPSIYNYLGLYFLLDGDYDNALEVFNTVLELDPEYRQALFHRGLNFYYGGRYHLAEQDFLNLHYANKDDPYPVLWLYLNDLKYKPEEAQKNLVERSVGLSENYWGSYIVYYYLDKLKLEELHNIAQRFVESKKALHDDLLTEIYFYLAKQKLNAGQVEGAENYFRLTMANQKYNFVEYRFALLELNRLKDAKQNKTIVTE